MKKTLLTLLASLFLFSCGGGSSSDSNGSALIAEEFNYQFLSNEVELKSLVEGIFDKLGENISKVNKIDISVQRPSKEGIKRANAQDNASVVLTYLNPNDPKTLQECRYHFDKREWNSPTTKTVRLLRGDVETFVLADEMYDASSLTSDRVVELVKKTWDKYKDEAKYSDQWIRSILIENGEIKVVVKGFLESNGLEKTEYLTQKL